jgi:hypothetical protein
MNQNIPAKDQCVLVCNAVQGKAGIYFRCPLRFSSNSYTYINHITKNMQQFPIRISVTESVKTTNMRIDNEIPPFTLSYLIFKRYCEKNKEYENKIKRAAWYDDLSIYN